MTKYLRLASLFLTCASSMLNAIPIVTWSDTTVFNVIDSDVIWKKKITLPVGDTVIHAIDFDIVIYMPHDVDFFANDSGDSQLILRADAGRTITVRADEAVTFNSSCLNNNSLTFRWEGSGNVIFQVIPDND